MKISNNISKRVLNIGPSFKPVTGGIAQVMAYYNYYVFENFRFVANSCPGNKTAKLVCAITAYIKTLTKLLFNKVDILHIHTASNVSFKRSVIFARLGFLFKKKVIMHIHAGSFMEYYNTSPEYVSSVLKKCHKVVALSEVWKRRFEKEIGLSNVVVINNIIPEPTVVEKQMFSDKAVHGLFLGAIKDQKGIFDLLDVVNEHKFLLDGKFVLHIGGNEQVNRLQSFINEHGLNNIVKYEGWVDEDKKVLLMNNCDILFLPSYIEGVPICVLEAMSYGLPVVTTNIGGIPSLIENEKNGYTNIPGDLVALWNSTFELIANEGLRKVYGKLSLEKIVQYYPDKIATQLMKLYNN